MKYKEWSSIRDKIGEKQQISQKHSILKFHKGQN